MRFIKTEAKRETVTRLQVSVNINYISAERFWERGKSPPPGVHISTNVNVVGVEAKNENLAVPFVVTINYAPSIAQINFKGQAILSGEQSELKKIRDDYKNQRAPPPVLIQTIANASLVEATILSRSLNIPPPIPLPGLPEPRKPDKERPSYVG